jgi:hypothetical protein
MTAPDLDTLIGVLPDRPPAPARPMADVSKQATRLRRARRRRRTLGAGALLALVIVGALVVLDRGEDAVELDVAGPTTTVDSEDPPPASPPDAELETDPAGSLTDGQSITVTGSGFPLFQQISVSMCEQGVTIQTAADLCDINAVQYVGADADGRIDLSYEIRRVIRTANGVIDCAMASGRCVLGAANLMSSDTVATVPLTVDPVGPGPSSGQLTADRTENLRDDQPITVRGTGFRPNDEVYISECAVQAAIYAYGGTGCSGSGTSGVEATADETGTFTATFPAQRLLFRTDLPTGGFEDCADLSGGCELRVGTIRSTPVRLPIGFDLTERRPAPPSLAIDEPLPLALGQEVTVRGKDFQPGMSVKVGTCGFPAGEASNSSTCSYPLTGWTSADAGGSFTVTVPASDQPTCLEGPGRCGLAVYAGEAAYARLPLTFAP